MKTSTDFTKDIITEKEYHKINQGDSFLPYLVQRYISGISPDHCHLINEILNTKLKNWRDNQEIYDFLKCIIPKSKTYSSKYFKTTQEKKEYKVDIKGISESLEISQKELRELLDYFPDLVKSMQENPETILKAIK
jgi:hypothetical protein